MRILLYIFLLCLGLNVFGQELVCEDFKNGTFLASVDDDMDIEFEILRQGNSQTETVTKIPQELLDLGYPTESKKLNIFWIDDCTYRLTADNSDGKIDELSRVLNDSGGVLTQLVKIEGNCFHYKSSLTIENEEIILYGKICKVNEF